MRPIAFALAACALALAAAPALAQLPVSIAPDLFPFPGAHESPGSARYARGSLGGSQMPSGPT